MAMFILDGNQSHKVLDYQFETSSKPLFTIDRSKLAGKATNLSGAKIIIIANLTSEVKTPLEAAKTLADIDACDFSVSGIDIPSTGIPMRGDLDQSLDPDDTSLNGSILEIPLKCLYAKIVFNISVDPNQSIAGTDQSFELESWQVFNVPNQVRLGSPASANETQFANGTMLGLPASTQTNKSGNVIYESSQDGDYMTFTFYMPEHKVNGADVDYPWDEADNDQYADYRQYLKPTLVQDNTSPIHPCETDKKATYVEIKGHYIDHNNRSREVTYTIYLGSNNYDNFHILRNHQYNNYIVIKGVNNSVTANGSWVTYDHRVNVKQIQFSFGLERETLLDSHWEIRPIRIDFNDESNESVVEVIIPNDCNWIGIESPSATTISGNATKYCDVANTSTAYGKRRYFTTNLVTTDLSGTAKKTIAIHKNNTEDHTIADLREPGSQTAINAHTVWAYIDENVNVDDPNSNPYRYATVTCKYYETEDKYKAHRPDVTEDYIFRQNGLHHISYGGHDYYIEYYEEYLYNYDTKEQYGYTSDGMAWGMENTELSSKYPAAALDNVGGSGSNTLKNKVKEGLSKLPMKYDFYLQRDFDNNQEIPHNNLTKRDNGNGKVFTNEIATAAKLDMKSLTTKDVPQSAIQYALNKNKRKPDGSLDYTSAGIKWYLPAIDEIEEICKGGYNQFEVFQDKLYWSSQPSFIRGVMDLYDRAQNAYHVQFFKEDSGLGYLHSSIKNDAVVLGDASIINGKGRARATKVNSLFQNVKSESYGIQAAVITAVTAPLIGSLDYLDIGFFYCYPGNAINFTETKNYQYLGKHNHTYNLVYSWNEPTTAEYQNYLNTGSINNNKTTVTVYQGNKSSDSTYQADWKYYYYFYDEGNCSRDEIHRVRCAYKAN